MQDEPSYQPAGEPDIPPFGEFSGQGAPAQSFDAVESVNKETRQMNLILHLSQLAFFTGIPFASVIAPLLIWQLKKDELPGIDDHGREIVNWQISMCIYFFIAIVLIFVVIGIPILIALAIIEIVFPIVGAIKANDNVCWRYPMTIRLL